MSIRAEARQSMKYVARDALRERWQRLTRFTLPASGIAAGAYLVLNALTPNFADLGVTTLAGYVASITQSLPALAASYLMQFILGVLIYGPLAMCAASFFLPRSSPEALLAERALFKNAPPPRLPRSAESFSWFLEPARLLRALRLRLCTELIRLAARVLCILPGTAIILSLVTSPASPDYYSARLVSAAAMTIAGYALAEIFCERYRAAPFLMAQEPDMTVRRALFESAGVMRGRSFEYFLFDLSFLPWYALSLATFGAALLYVLPYRVTCEAMFMRYADSGGLWRMFEKGYNDSDT